MGQVPHDLIIGRGRLASHLSYYLSLSAHPYKIQTWHRGNSERELNQLLNSAHSIFLCINDDALSEWVQSIEDKSKIVHFSGSQAFTKVFGAHPLMTFSTDLYTKEVYEQIPFIVDQEKEKFLHFFPSLKNKVYEIHPEQKALYHAFCVLSGNFTTIMWSALALEMKNRLQLPENILNTYLKTTAENTLTNHFSALTGPLKRGDQKVIETHQAILQGSVWSDLYRDMLKLYERYSP